MPSHQRRLSAREREIILLLVNGYNQRQIAKQMYLSPKTISIHLSNARIKYDATSKEQLIAILIFGGELEKSNCGKGDKALS